ncbi:MAG: cytochrome c [Micropepsaceae bacterium]
MLKSALAGGPIAIVFVATLFAIGCTADFDPSTNDATASRPGVQSTAATTKTPARHSHYIRNGVPAAYRGRLNLFKPTIGNLIEGARLYDQSCAVCHGLMGVGDGEAGEKLALPPADLSASLAQPLYRDDFFFWTIADGGSQFGTDMPPFKSALSKGEIWKIVTFMRAAFAERTASPAARDAISPP